METKTLMAEVREGSGKGPARQLRMRGLIPAVFYGPGKEATSLTVSPTELAKLLSGPYGRNQVIELHIGDAKELTLVRDLEVHPVTLDLLHADFYGVSLSRTVRGTVPFQTRGRAIGVQKGGKLRVIYRSLPVRSTPDKMPDVIEVDVGPLDGGDIYRVKNLPLPEGVSVEMPAERPLITLDLKEREAEKEDAPAAKDDKKKK